MKIEELKSQHRFASVSISWGIEGACFCQIMKPALVYNSSKQQQLDNNDFEQTSNSFYKTNSLQ